MKWTAWEHYIIATYSDVFRLFLQLPANMFKLVDLPGGLEAVVELFCIPILLAFLFGRSLFHDRDRVEAEYSGVAGWFFATYHTSRVRESVFVDYISELSRELEEMASAIRGGLAWIHDVFAAVRSGGVLIALGREVDL